MSADSIELGVERCVGCGTIIAVVDPANMRSGISGALCSPECAEAVYEEFFGTPGNVADLYGDD